MPEDRYRRLFDAAQEIVWAHRGGIIVLANEFAARFVGAPSSDALVGRTMLDFIHPDDRALSLRRRAMALALEQNSVLPPQELRVSRGDGSYATVEFRAQPFDDATGVAVLGIGRDVSDRVAAQTAALESQRLLAAFMDHTPFPMFVKNRDGRYLLMNRAARSAVGALDKDIRGLAPGDVVPADVAARAMAQDRRVLDRGETVTSEGPASYGKGGWSLVVKFPIHDAGGAIAGLGGFEIDLSERRRLEEQLERSARLEAVGKLTGGMAHDFNNLLTVIFGNLERALEPTLDDAGVRGAVRGALAAAERGAELTNRLLAFARKQPLAPAAFDLNAQVRGMSTLLQRTIGETIELQTQLAADLRPALADAAQVEAALLNLLLNARDAMPTGGLIIVETANTPLDETSMPGGEAVPAGDYVMLAVSDNGTGMTPDVLKRAVEPFFTTKDVGKGSGLGLSMIYGFARQSGGYLKLYSEPGKGTTIRLYLPAAPVRAGTAPGIRPARSLPRGTETILAVEDETEVRRVVAAQLESLGYRVLQAADGPEALKVLAAEPGIDLLFTDVVMPKGMSGQALAEEAHRSRPELKVLFTTGYTEEAIVHAGRLDPGVTLLQKPYPKAILAHKIREVLDA